MNKRLLILVLSALLLPVFASAQSLSEMEAAKAMAKSYGYSESEIEALLGNASKTTTRTESPAELETTLTQDSPLLVKQAKIDEEEEEDISHKIYGHDFFNSKALSIIPSINAPAPANYILGPGDDVSIDVWGNTTAKINSVIGRDGWGIKRFCRKLMKLGLLSYIGSDAHNMVDRRCHMGECIDYVEKKMGREYADLIMRRNPQNIVDLSKKQ